MGRFRNLFIALFLLLGSFGFIREALAEEAKPTPTASTEEQPDPDLVSPRKTIRTFFNGVGQVREGDVDGYDLILKTLDLSKLPKVVRSSEGRDVAVQLLAIINRTKKIDYAKIPDRVDGEPWVIYKSPKGGVVIDKVGPNWKFSSASVLAATDIFRLVEDEPLISDNIEQQDIETTRMRLRRSIPKNLKGTTFLIEDWKWVVLMGVIFGSYILKLLFLLLFNLLTGALRNRFSHLESASKIKTSANPLAYALLFKLLSIGAPYVGFRTVLESYLILGLRVASTYALLVAIYRLIDVAAEFLLHHASKTDTKADDLLIPLLQKVGKVLVIIVGFLVILSVFEIDVTGLIAGLGLGGLAFALAAKDTVENIFGSVTVLLDRPFKIGDFVIVGGIEGTVESIGLRSTKIRTPVNSLVSMPNSTLIKTHVDNLGARQYRRTRVLLGVTYDTPSTVIEAFRDGIQKLIAEHPKTRKDFYQVHFHDFGPSSLDIIVNVFFTVADFAGELKERESLFLNILQLAEELGVNFAFPSQSLYVEGTPEHPFRGMDKPANAEEYRERAREIAAKLSNSESD